MDFGYSRTSHAGGAAGEIGGRVWRSLTPAYYAKRIAPRTLNDRLRASGRFSVTQSHGSGGVMVGWFNSASRGWRTPNSMVFRIPLAAKPWYSPALLRLEALLARWQTPRTACRAVCQWRKTWEGC
jgi:hypothetical protein